MCCRQVSLNEQLTNGSLLQNGAKTFGSFSSFDLQCSSSGCLKDLAHTFFGFGRAFEVLEGANLFCHRQALLVGNWNLLHLCKLRNGSWIRAQVHLVAHQNDGNVRAKVLHFGPPFLHTVLKLILICFRLFILKTKIKIHIL